MFELGRLCIKTAGRDAGKKAIIINIIDKKYVMIDGETRRRKCNIAHLEPLDKVIKINKDAPHEDVKKEFSKLGLKVKDTKPKEKKQRPKKVRKKKEVVVEKTKEKKKLAKEKKADTKEKKEVKEKPKVKKEEKTEIKSEKKEKPKKVKGG